MRNRTYKEEQVKTRGLLKAWKLITGYKFNSFPNRSVRRKGNPADYATDNNVQTYRPSEHQTSQQASTPPPEHQERKQ